MHTRKQFAHHNSSVMLYGLEGWKNLQSQVTNFSRNLMDVRFTKLNLNSTGIGDLVVVVVVVVVVVAGVVVVVVVVVVVHPLTSSINSPYLGH